MEKQKQFIEKWHELGNFFDEAMKREQIIGSSLYFVHDKNVYKKFYGFADKSSQQATNEQTIYSWASITKTFTGIAVMQLRDEGKLKLDDPVAKYLPEIEEVHNKFSPLTIQQLLNHSSCFFLPMWRFLGQVHFYEANSWEDLASVFSRSRIHFEPGSRHIYSNIAFIFLGKIIEVISQKSYETYIKKHILDPLEMYNSYFHHSPLHLQKDRSNSYLWKNSKMETKDKEFSTDFTVSNGGLNAPLGNMLSYIRFLIGEENNVLKQSSLREMWKAIMPVDEEESMGLAFFIRKKNGLSFIGHTGSLQGFLSFFYVQPESKTACINVFNTSTLNKSGKIEKQLLFKLREKLFLEIFPLFH